MTSMPASRSARAMILAPRSWPSRPGLATTTRILGRVGLDSVSAVMSDLDDERVALPATGADGDAAEAAAATAQLVDDAAKDAGTGGADRVAERDGASVDVDLVLVDAEHAHRVERDRGERLVDLPHVDVLGFETGLVKRLLGGRGGGAGEGGEGVGGLSMGDDLSERLLAIGDSPLVGGDHKRAATVVDAGRVAGGVGAPLTDQPGQ